MINKTYIGVDIGLKGGVAIIDSLGNIVKKYPMPVTKEGLDIHSLDNIFWEYEGFNGLLVLEKLGPIFGTSKKTTWSMGFQVGAVRTICVARSIPFLEVPAKTWQKEMFFGMKPIHKSGTTKIDTKAMALVSLIRLFPDYALIEPHEGITDAILIAEYSRRKNL